MEIKSNSLLLIEKEDTLPDLKDPCPVFDGKKWHLYGSYLGIGDDRIIHFTTENINSFWNLEGYIDLENVQGYNVAAPGVIYDNKMFHMFIHTDTGRPYGTIEYLTSKDGHNFIHHDSALKFVFRTREAGIYDAQPLKFNNECYLVYAGFPAPYYEYKRGDIFLAKSLSGKWSGPWKRLGIILNQERVPFQNQSTDMEFQWGLTAPQIVNINSDNFILFATCYLSHKKLGSKERFFYAVSNKIEGPYEIKDIIIKPDNKNSITEVGFGGAVIVNKALYIFYQAHIQSSSKDLWRYGKLEIELKEIF